MTDAVNHPQHYTSSKAKCKVCAEPVECIDITQHMGFCLGNAVKYIWRAGLKSEDKTIQDLEKAIWYISRHIQNMEDSQYEIKEPVKSFFNTEKEECND